MPFFPLPPRPPVPIRYMGFTQEEILEMREAFDVVSHLRGTGRYASAIAEMELEAAQSALDAAQLSVVTAQDNLKSAKGN